MKRVLVIDDDESIRVAICRILRLGGYEPVEAVDGLDGCEVFIRHAFVAVITDLVMPNQEGIETIQRLRELDPAVPIVAISGAMGIDFSSLDDAKLIGADAVIAKPFGIEDLLGTLDEVVDQAPPAQPMRAPYSPIKRQVLVIDDDDDVRRLMGEMLERGGSFEVVEASSGSAGVNAFLRNHCIAVVADLVMPDQSGIETIKQLREIDGQVPIIAVSGFAWSDSDPLAQQARAAGANAVLGKPFRPH